MGNIDAIESKTIYLVDVGGGCINVDYKVWRK